MTLPTWPELTALGIAIGGILEWFSRQFGYRKKAKELQEALDEAIKEAELTSAAHMTALAAKDEEIEEWRRQVERRDDRINVLQDRLYTRGG